LTASVASHAEERKGASEKVTQGSKQTSPATMAKATRFAEAKASSPVAGTLFTVILRSVASSLDSAGIAQVIDAKKGEIVRLLTESKLVGTCKLSIAIDATGKVTAVTIEQESFASRELMGKITNFFKETRFPPPGASGGKVELVISAEKK
jgi:hypothetical protein